MHMRGYYLYSSVFVYSNNLSLIFQPPIVGGTTNTGQSHLICPVLVSDMNRPHAQGNELSGQMS